MAEPTKAGSRSGGNKAVRMGDVKALTPAVKYVIDQFLEEKHLHSLHASLGSKWDVHQSLTAAMKLMESYGVVLSPEEEAQITNLDEPSMVEALVSKMPQQSKEQFEHFFLQLQLIVSTAQRIRKGLEEGRPQQVENALDDAESTGIISYILKMSIVQAGNEVATLKAQHEKWVLEADKNMQKLLRGKDDAMQAQRTLAEAKKQLAHQRGSHNKSAQKAIMNLAGGSGAVAKSGTFMGWAAVTRQNRHENQIRMEYEERLHEAQQRLIDYRETQLGNVRGVLLRKAAQGDQALMALVFDTMKGDVEERKSDAAQAGAVAEVEAKLAKFKAEQAENTKKVMSRMAAASEMGSVTMTFQAWTHFVVEYKKNKDLEDQVKAQEQKFSAYMKEKAENAQGVVAKMAGASNSGLLHNVMESWFQILVEEKEAAAIDDLLNSQDGKFKMFASRNSENAKDIMRKATMQLEAFHLMRAFNVWRLDTKCELLMRSFQGKVEGKRGQLQKVHGLFRSFAGQLEQSLKEGTPRDPSAQNQMARKMYKNQQTVSLPDIHARPANVPARPSSRGSSGRRGVSVSGRRTQDAGPEQVSQPRATAP